jgi:hypothetical protein
VILTLGRPERRWQHPQATQLAGRLEADPHGDRVAGKGDRGVGDDVARRLGFESLWTPAGGVPDSFHVCAAWSQDTSLRTGISVVPAPRMWTPLSLAAQAATVARLSSGRFAGEQVTAGRIGHGEGVRLAAPGWPRTASLGVADLPPAPVYLAARQAFGTQVLGYALGRPGVPESASYRGLFAQIGFDAELSAGLDEAMVRIITARPGLQPVVETMEALTPALIRSATG